MGGGQGMDFSSFVVTESPLGLIWVWAVPQGVCGLGFGDQPSAREVRRLARYGIATPRRGPTEVLTRACQELTEYFRGERYEFDLPLDLRGTPFQHSVWWEIHAIPYGKTVTYGEIALRVGRPRAYQAVGQAVGANPVAIVVPCHRVVGADGKLTGYGGGVDRKAALLELEQRGLQLRMSLDQSVA